MPDGTVQLVDIQVDPTLSPALQARYPGTQTYHVQGHDKPTIVGRVDRTLAGFHAMLITDHGMALLDPLEGTDPSLYKSYWKHDAPKPDFQCLAESSAPAAPETLAFPTHHPSGAQRSTYRLAMTATGEYTEHFGGQEQAAAQITTTVDRVRGIYEHELAISLELVAMNIYEDHTTDPFPNGDSVDGALLNQNQADLDANVGSANYDVGHIVSQGGSGGLAQLSAVCGGSKARGGTSLAVPSGDGFDVDYVAHELGHQFGGNHTFNGNAGSCAGGNWEGSAAYEPGSGTTIMAYAGICSPQNVQLNSDPFFHTKSFDEMTTFRDGGGAACGTTTLTGNHPPTVEAGADCTIPRETPFTLTAEGDDADSDPMTFSWEQYDLGNHEGAPSSTFTTGPLFRSRPASTSPSRTFPVFSDLLSGAATPWEVLPSVDRTLNFRVTARDNRATGGVDWDTMAVHVTGAPFRFTSPTQGMGLECGLPVTVTWDVGGGAMAPEVALEFSSDGGTTFSPVLASTPNDGSQSVSLPAAVTANARLLLKPSQECFFAVSRSFSIADTLPPILPPALPTLTRSTCLPGDEPLTVTPPTATDLCNPYPTVTGQVTMSNGVPRVPPLPVVGDQVTLDVGTHVITWTASDGQQSSTVTQTVIVRPSIYVSSELLLRDRAKVQGPSGGSASVANAGSLATELGVEAVVGDILSVAAVTLRDRARVNGDVTSSSSINRGNQVVITGTARPYTPLSMPAVPDLLDVTFPPPGGDLVFNPAPTPVSLPPGSYGNVILNSGASVRLVAGDYYFVSFIANAASTIIDPSGGHVQIYIHSGFAFRGAFVDTSGQTGSFTLGYAGSADAVMEAPFKGLLIAPNARISFGTANASQFRGQFYGKSFEVRPDVRLVCDPSLPPS